MKQWSLVYEDYLNKGQETLWIFYEELREKPIEHVERILDFLNIDYPNKEERKQRIECIKKHLNGNFKRQHSDENVFNPYRKRNFRKIEKMIHYLKLKFDKKLGKHLPWHLYTFPYKCKSEAILPEHPVLHRDIQLCDTLF